MAERHRAPQRPPLVHKTDLVVALIILAACAYLYYLTTQFEVVIDAFAQDIQPSFFPRLLLFLIGLLALVLPFESRLMGNGKRLDKGRQQAVPPMSYLTMGLLVLLVLALPLLGMYLMLILVCTLLPMLWGERRLLLLIPYALIFATFIMLLFGKVLKVYLEPGIFGLGFR